MDEKILDFLRKHLKVRVTCRAERTNYEVVESASVAVEIYVEDEKGQRETIYSDQDSF